MRESGRNRSRGALPFSLAAFLLAACTPSFTPLSDSVRLSGTVRGGDAGLLEVEAYARCSRRFIFFNRCPGKLLGHTKIGKPGPFLIQIGSDSQDVSVVASRGSAGRESVCAAKTVSADELTQPLELTLAEGPCPLERLSSPTSAGGYTAPGGGHGGHAH